MRLDRLRVHSRPRPQSNHGNVALVPGSLLAYQDKWRTLADELVPGSILVVVPSGNPQIERKMRIVISMLRAKGRSVVAVADDQLMLGQPRSTS